MGELATNLASLAGTPKEPRVNSAGCANNARILLDEVATFVADAEASDTKLRYRIEAEWQGARRRFCRAAHCIHSSSSTVFACRRNSQRHRASVAQDLKGGD